MTQVNLKSSSTLETEIIYYVPSSATCAISEISKVEIQMGIVGKIRIS